MYAQLQGLTPFVIYQGHWNVMERSFERDIIPMARTLGTLPLVSCISRDIYSNLSAGLALAPWDVLRAGRFRTDSEDEERRKTGELGRSTFMSWERTEDEVKMSRALEKVAGEVGTKNIRAGEFFGGI